MSRNTIVISINAAWNIINFRKGVISALQERGYRIVALAPDDQYRARLEQIGVELHPIEIDSQGMSPFRDLILLARYRSILSRLEPVLFLGYTIKPNIFGSLAAHSLGIPVINNISGLGTAFITEGLLTRIATGLYRIALRRSDTVFFQNSEDRQLFLDRKIVRPEQTKLLPGSGIDLQRFHPAKSAESEQPTFLLVGRLLWDKGVREFVEAARLVRARRPGARFQLLGFLDVPNRTAVSRSEVDGWIGEGLIEYLGARDDVGPFIAAADCIVLPSYREGLPRALLEGAAMGKPLIASDVAGCRDVVEDGRNGYLCAVRDPASLAEAMMRMADLPHHRRVEMGALGRKTVEQRFDQQIVIEHYVAAIEAALG
ncbi:MAG: glycosyltransferase family 1 protein [Alphaproteobacteria bacterium]|nr:glycosyltransferase family 1 protein [Alphaproteobacteria bacterium]